MVKELTDASVMHWGKYKGERLIDIPADYLLYIYESYKCNKQLRAYIEDNLDVLKKQQNEGQ